ncbi:N-acetyl-gamma-glutamyl-phosphate reductase [Flaviaesturariibacter flavus]|uniref:N-acetyl-gamma-glutamyl-phosphate reductase n=1 Tax=Flaviaesturariibacter flavus TaxID=2502780 RepID=A0A4R1BKH1_9BACT|nr:N-acetyl-gamma-glutamyl-phosphate reductase [Flaviaesturariibacter flavus]TCJ17718.1 N-acetyl-gamma-glutamyl-phosphate reductase [Flaviaesturariibacter flavus]
MKAKVGIVGGAGYTGGELLRLLLRHPHAEIAFVHSRSSAGAPVHSVHSDLLGETELTFSSVLQPGVDLLFLCVGHGEARKFLGQNEINPSVRIIDLSQDFRLQSKSGIGERSFTYGLPELRRDAIRNAHNIANPGCFATAIQLALLPLAKAGGLGEAFVTGITGSTGAGQGLSATSHFSWRANNIQAYKTLAHQHGGEIGESVESLQPEGFRLHFVPWRGDFPRGIFVSATVDFSGSQQEATDLYRSFYEGHPFTTVSESPIHLKQVVNTNKCVLQPEVVDGKLVVHSAIDNLLKGASGQAVQNFNLMMGLDETAGLLLKPLAF